MFVLLSLQLFYLFCFFFITLLGELDLPVDDEPHLVVFAGQLLVGTIGILHVPHVHVNDSAFVPTQRIKYNLKLVKLIGGS